MEHQQKIRSMKYKLWLGNEIIRNTEVLKSNPCDYREVYILVRGDKTITGHAVTQVAFKDCAPDTNCITKIDRTTVDDAEDLDFVMSVYNLLEYSSNYSEKNVLYGFILKTKELILMILHIIIILNIWL